MGWLVLVLYLALGAVLAAYMRYFTLSVGDTFDAWDFIMIMFLWPFYLFGKK